MRRLTRRDTLQAVAAPLFGVASTTAIANGSLGDASDGHAWAFETSGPVEGAPTVVGGSVYVVSNERYLYAIDASTGELEWETEVGGYEYSPMRGKRVPTVVDGTVYVTSSSRASGQLHAIDAETGEHEWHVEVHGAATVPTVSDDTLYLPNGQAVAALDADTGKQIWVHELEEGGGMFGPAPAVVDGTVYVGGRPHGTMTAPPQFHALDADSGEAVWRSEQRASFSAPTVVDDRVYVGFDPVLVFDTDTGDEAWTVDGSGSGGGWLVSSPTVADGTVYVGDSDGTIHAFGAEDGDERWTVETGDSITSSPTVADGTVFVGSDDGHVYGLHTETGEADWSFSADAAIPFSPIVVDGVVFFATEAGSVHAVETEFEGHSDGSRIAQGTLNHHHVWSDESPQTISIPADAEGDRIERPSEPSTPDPTPSPAATPSPTQTTTPTPSPTATPTATPTPTSSNASLTDGVGPGFGVLGTLAGFGTAGYLLLRRFGESGTNADE